MEQFNYIDEIVSAAEKLYKQLDEVTEPNKTYDLTKCNSADVEELVTLLENALITDHGSINYAMVNQLSDRGYLVYPVERDGFGWLIGGFRKEKSAYPTVCFG